MAEWLRSGLQIRVPRFDSGWHLQLPIFSSPLCSCVYTPASGQSRRAVNLCHRSVKLNRSGVKSVLSSGMIEIIEHFQAVPIGIPIYEFLPQNQLIKRVPKNDSCLSFQFVKIFHKSLTVY